MNLIILRFNPLLVSVPSLLIPHNPILTTTLCSPSTSFCACPLFSLLINFHPNWSVLYRPSTSLFVIFTAQEICNIVYRLMFQILRSFYVSGLKLSRFRIHIVEEWTIYHILVRGPTLVSIDMILDFSVNSHLVVCGHRRFVSTGNWWTQMTPCPTELSFVCKAIHALRLFMDGDWRDNFQLSSCPFSSYIIQKHDIYPVHVWHWLLATSTLTVIIISALQKCFDLSSVSFMSDYVAIFTAEPTWYM